MKTIERASDTETHIDVFSELEDSFNEICEWAECEEERTHLLACPKCPAVENLCEQHAMMMKAAPPRQRVIFNRTCNHNVPMVACGKIRVKN